MCSKFVKPQNSQPGFKVCGTRKRKFASLFASSEFRPAIWVMKFFEGIGELRLGFGPGYRLYFVKRGEVLIILLCGGGKSSQSRDVAKAIAMAKEV